MTKPKPEDELEVATKPAKRVDRKRDDTPTPTTQICKGPRCVGLHREGDFLCANCRRWHSLPCPAEATRHR